ncbi:hypothetical protein Ocin01_18751 [Orchesella cincta]|uniref:Uncharacterized protein n=1 Tax=Orchesella cincta TaxID=48709 RepID=A0A1D2M4U6_ORCCI|nr:hypothetical protein Ocin01_18751 [Orchesella cincta]
MFKSNYEKQLIGKLRRLSIGGRKLRLFCPSSRPPIGARAVCPYGMFLEDIVTTLALETVGLSLLHLGTEMIQMRGIGLAHLHLLESVSIEFPPSRSPYSVILNNCTHIKHFHLMPQSLEGMKPKDVKNIRIPTLTCLSLPIALNESSEWRANAHGIREIFKTITAALGFVAKHDGLEKLVCHQSFFECDARFQGLSHAQRFVQRVPGPYCVGEFQQNVLDELEKRARELSISMRKLRTIKIKQVAKVHNTFVSSCPTFVQRGPQAVIWKKFLEHQNQNQCQNLSLGMPGLPQAFVERFFQRAGVHVKSLELRHLMLDRTLDPPFILAGVREGFPPQLKEVAICNLKLTSQDAQFILVELELWNTSIFRVLESKARMESSSRRFCLDTSTDQPSWYLRILSVPGGRNNEPMNWIELNWVDLNKNSRTGYYEQLEQEQYQNEESKLYI